MTMLGRRLSRAASPARTPPATIAPKMHAIMLHIASSLLPIRKPGQAPERRVPVPVFGWVACNADNELSAKLALEKKPCIGEIGAFETITCLGGTAYVLDT